METRRTKQPKSQHGGFNVANRSGGEVRVGPQGRIVIPLSVRKAFGLQVGDKLVARLEEGYIVLEKREHILTRLKARFTQIPPEVSLVEELLADRREQARREEKN